MTAIAQNPRPVVATAAVHRSAAPQIPLAATLFITAMVVATVPIGLMRGISVYETTASYNYEMMYPTEGLSALRTAMLGLTVLAALFCVFRMGAEALRTPKTVAAKAIWGTLLLWWAGQVAINIARMPSDAINPKNWYMPMLIAGLYCVSTLPYDSLVTTIRRPMWIIMAVTLALAFIAPLTVFAPSPGLFGYRLHGFFCHANAFAMFVVYYALMPGGPVVRPARVHFQNSVAVLLLLLTICKTVLVLSFGSLAALIFVKLSNPASLRPLRIFVVVVCCAVGLVVWLNKTSLIYTVADSANVDASGLENMSSRTMLWDMMLADWQTRPWLGFGPSAWKEEKDNYLVEGQLLPHAHNQYVQTLWETGLIGMPLLLAHLAVVVAVGIVRFRDRDFVFVPLLIILLGRTFTEVPLQPLSFDLQWCMYLLFYAMLASAHRETTLAKPRFAFRRFRSERVTRGTNLLLPAGCSVGS